MGCALFSTVKLKQLNQRIIIKNSKHVKEFIKLCNLIIKTRYDC